MEAAKKVCIEMLHERKWIIEDDDGNNTEGSGPLGDHPVDSFDTSTIREIVGKTNDEKKFIVFFLPGIKLNIANVKDCIKILQDRVITHCIIIYNNNTTSSAKKVINNFVDASFELFMCDELQYNVTKHYLVPRHIELTPQEREQFISDMGQDIPVLQKTDPISRFYNYQKGTIVKVLRKDSSIAYRLVK